MSPSYLLSSSPIMAPKKVKRRRRPPLYLFWTRFDALSNKIIEEEGKESKWFSYRPLPPAHPLPKPPIFFVEKRCFFTITRPNGATRSYTSKPEFARKAEARVAAAAVAVDMGAIVFIKHGSPEAVAK